MRTPKTVFILAAAAILGSSAAAIAVHAQRRMVPVSTTIREMVDDLDDAARGALRDGCVESDGKNGKRFCGESAREIGRVHDDASRAADALRARPTETRGKAVRAIRSFRKDDALSLTYRSTASNPYRDDDGNIETYVDDKGYEYWVDPQNDVLVQAGPSAGLHPAPRKTGKETRLPVPELRETAIAYIETQLPDFLSIRPTLHPLEDNKNKETYFFRWDDFSRPVKETEMPPFVQVGLYADGTLASFTNTLTR